MAAECAGNPGRPSAAMLGARRRRAMGLRSPPPSDMSPPRRRQPSARHPGYPRAHSVRRRRPPDWFEPPGSGRTTLDPAAADPSAASLSKEALRRKYGAERDKRLRPDGNDQYLQLKGRFAHYATDPYTPVTPRAPRTDHVTFAFVGGGFAGLATAARLSEAGVNDVRIVEKGGDFGGTWYWNRYPGAQCDTASLVYMPLLEETGYMPTEKYAHAPEILAHCQRIGKLYGLYDNALFHTEVVSLDWDEAQSRWNIRTTRGDAFSAQFVGMGTGPLHVP